MNWTRLNWAPMERASALARVVSAGAGEVVEEHVTAAHEGRQQLADGGLLAFHHAADVRGQPLGELPGRERRRGMHSGCGPSPFRSRIPFAGTAWRMLSHTAWQTCGNSI